MRRHGIARSECSQVTALCIVHAAWAWGSDYAASHSLAHSLAHALCRTSPSSVCPCCMLRCMVWCRWLQTEEASGQNILILCNAIGSPVDSKYRQPRRRSIPQCPPCLVERLLQSPREYLWSALPPAVSSEVRSELWH